MSIFRIQELVNVGTTKTRLRISRVCWKPSINFDDDPNWMNGYVDYSEAESILQQLHLSAQELRSRNQQRLHSFLDGPPVWYIHGRHRVKAAKSIGPDDIRGSSVSGLSTPSRWVAPALRGTNTDEAGTELFNVLSQEGIFPFSSATSSGRSSEWELGGTALLPQLVVPACTERFMCAAPSNMLPQEGACPFSPALGHLI